MRWVRPGVARCACRCGNLVPAVPSALWEWRWGKQGEGGAERSPQHPTPWIFLSSCACCALIPNFSFLLINRAPKLSRHISQHSSGAGVAM